MSSHDMDCVTNITSSCAKQSLSRLNAALVAIAVKKYRVANAQLPKTRTELGTSAPEPVPIDPFNGRPPRYKKLAEGYVVYSVGEDGKDDGGDEKKDITFTVER